MSIQEYNDNFSSFSSFLNSKMECDQINIDGITQEVFPRTNDEPPPLDNISKYLKLHTWDENLTYIRQLRKNKTMQYCNSNADFEVVLDNDNFYLKVKRRNPNANIKNIIAILIDNIKLSEYRHVDLSENNLQDNEIYELRENFLNLYGVISKHWEAKGITSLILSDNNVSVEGLSSLLRHFKICPVEYVFLDQNSIFFSVNQFWEHIDSDYRSNNLMPLKKSNPKIKLTLLDLSLNFISNGELIAGDPFANEDIPHKYHNDMKEFIENSSQIHSQRLTHEIVDKFEKIMSYSHSICYPEEIENITTHKGCIVIAEKYAEGFIGRWLFNRGHAIMAIEWIPDPIYGQRQIILAELKNNPHYQNSLTLNIYKISPSKLKRKLKTCANCSTLFWRNENIKNILIPRLCRSRKEMVIFDYFVLSSRNGGERQGRLNCFTWADEMLNVVGLKTGGLQYTKIQFYVLLSISVLLFVVIIGFLSFIP